MCKSFMLVVCCLSLFPIFFAVITSQTLFYELYTIDENILNQSDNETVDLLLYGSNKFKFHLDCSIYIYIYIKIYQIHVKIREIYWFTYIGKYTTHLFVCLFVYLSTQFQIHKYKTARTIPNQSGVYLGLMADKNQFTYIYIYIAILAIPFLF